MEVTLYYDEYGEPQDIDYYCPCEDFLTSDGICKHCVATILYYMHTDGQSKTVTSPFSMPLPLASEYDDRDTFYGNTSSVFSENSTVSQESIWGHPARTDNSMQQILRQFGNQENWMITMVHSSAASIWNQRWTFPEKRHLFPCVSEIKNVCRKKYSGIGAACTTDRDA